VWCQVSTLRRRSSKSSYNNAIYQVALTSLRNVVGQHVLDEVLKMRYQRCAQMTDAATEPWHPGQHGRDEGRRDPGADAAAMAQEAQAVREKRARIIAEASSMPRRSWPTPHRDREPDGTRTAAHADDHRVGAERTRRPS
jgi:regulator of protease activity HflC (stomatin/prohibitin superfamily)